ncbi:MAG: HAD family phosphatase [Cyanobacteriota bacterium]|nr:HAD family phosphatase [Cyanobacteriota bacterium]
MALQTVMMGFSGVLMNDEAIHADIINQLLIAENLRPIPLTPSEQYRLRYLGLGDLIRLRTLWLEQGRVLTPSSFYGLLKRKQEAYQKRVTELPRLPLIPYLVEALETMERLGLSLALVTGLAGEQVRYFLERTQLSSRFRVVITGEDIPLDQLENPGYLHQQALQQLQLSPEQALAIEATYRGIAASQAAGIPVVGLTTFFPFHMLQRRANWVIDSFLQMEWERILYWAATGADRPHRDPARIP